MDYCPSLPTRQQTPCCWSAAAKGSRAQGAPAAGYRYPAHRGRADLDPELAELAASGGASVTGR